MKTREDYFNVIADAAIDWIIWEGAGTNFAALFDQIRPVLMRCLWNRMIARAASGELSMELMMAVGDAAPTKRPDPEVN